MDIITPSQTEILARLSTAARALVVATSQISAARKAYDDAEREYNAAVMAAKHAEVI